MKTIEFIDAVYEMLGNMKSQGTKAIAVSVENTQFLRAMYARKPNKSAPSGAPTTQSAFVPKSAQQVSPSPESRPPTVQSKPATQAPPFKPSAAAVPQNAHATSAPPFKPPQTAQPQAASAEPSPAMATEFVSHACPATTTMDWTALEQTAKECKACVLCQERKLVVFGNGNPNADLMFIGGNPGEDEDHQGVPFVGKAGQLLTKIIGAMGFSRQDVYVANVVKCHPRKSGNPKPSEVETCLHFIRRQIQLVQPKAIVILGAVPLRYLLQKRNIMQHRGKWMDFEGTPVMPTYHPSFLLRKPEHKREVWEDVQLVMEQFGIQPPSKPNQ